MGAYHVIDYTKEDFTKKAERYDLILDVNRYRSISAYNRSLNPNGIYVTVGGAGAHLPQALLLGPWNSFISNKKICTVSQKQTKRSSLYE